MVETKPAENRKAGKLFIIHKLFVRKLKWNQGSRLLTILAMTFELSDISQFGSCSIITLKTP